MGGTKRGYPLTSRNRPKLVPLPLRNNSYCYWDGQQHLRPIPWNTPSCQPQTISHACRSIAQGKADGANGLWCKYTWNKFVDGRQRICTSFSKLILANENIRPYGGNYSNQSSKNNTEQSVSPEEQCSRCSSAQLCCWFRMLAWLCALADTNSWAPSIYACNVLAKPGAKMSFRFTAYCRPPPVSCGLRVSRSSAWLMPERVTGQHQHNSGQG